MRQKKNKDSRNEESHTIVQLNKSDIKVLIPDEYKKLKHKNPLIQTRLEIENNTSAFQKIVETSNNIVFFDKLKPGQTLPATKEELIEGIHNILNDEQGLVEVGDGYTKRGFRYIYSIVKELNKDIRGCKYHLLVQLFNEGACPQEFDAIQISGDFNEIQTTGIRDSIGFDLARRAGLVDFGNINAFEGWNEDPYDPNFKKGALMNLSERAGLDGLFPYHPLSQCRELLKAVLEDKMVLIEREENENKDDTKKNQSERDMMLMLFENKVDRYTYDVAVKGAS